MVNPLTRGFMVGGAMDQSNKDRDFGLKEKVTNKNIEQIDLGNFSQKRQSVIEQLAQMKDTISGVEARGASPEKVAKLKEAATAIAQQSMVALSQEAQLLGMNPQMEVLQPIQVALEAPSAAQQKAGDTLAVANELEAGGVPRAQAQGAAGIPQPKEPKKLEIEQLFDARQSAIDSGDTERAKALQVLIDKEVAGTGNKGLLTEAQQGKIQISLAEQATNARNFVESVNSLVGLIDEGGVAALGGAGAAARAVEGAANTAVGIAQNLDVDTTKFTNGKGAETRFDIGNEVLEKNATLSADQKSLIVELAYALAAANGQTGKGVSDRDFKVNLEQLGAAAGSPEGFKKVLKSNVERIDRKLKNEFKSKNKLLDREQEVPDVMSLFKGIESNKPSPAKQGGEVILLDENFNVIGQ